MFCLILNEKSVIRWSYWYLKEVSVDLSVAFLSCSSSFLWCYIHLCIKPCIILFYLWRCGRGEGVKFVPPLLLFMSLCSGCGFCGSTRLPADEKRTAWACRSHPVQHREIRVVLHDVRLLLWAGGSRLAQGQGRLVRPPPKSQFYSTKWILLFRFYCATLKLESAQTAGNQQLLLANHELSLTWYHSVLLFLHSHISTIFIVVFPLFPVV